MLQTAGNAWSNALFLGVQSYEKQIKATFLSRANSDYCHKLSACKI